MIHALTHLGIVNLIKLLLDKTLSNRGFTQWQPPSAKKNWR